jgi:acetyl esterase/lipase
MKYEYECSSFLRFTLKIAVVLGMFKKTINEKSSIKQKPFNYKGLTKSKICNLDIYSCYDNKDEVIIYLHGGGYLLGLDNMHIGFARKLQNKSKATVHIIDYPLAPVHKVDEVISEVYKTIREIVSTNINSNHHLI